MNQQPRANSTTATTQQPPKKKARGDTWRKNSRSATPCGAGSSSRQGDRPVRAPGSPRGARRREGECAVFSVCSRCGPFPSQVSLLLLLPRFLRSWRMAPLLQLSRRRCGAVVEGLRRLDRRPRARERSNTRFCEAVVLPFVGFRTWMHAGSVVQRGVPESHGALQESRLTHSALCHLTSKT